MDICLSKNDPVGLNVSKILKKGYIEIDDFLDFERKSDLNLVISKHESQSKIKCFSCHSTGNFSKADFGGKDKSLSVSNALAQSHCFLRLKKELKKIKMQEYAAIEATHHGPSSNYPCLFLEVGSSESEHNNISYCNILAKTALWLKENYGKIMESKAKIAIGIGGGHYSYGFSKLVDENLCIGHICPAYHLDSLDKKMLLQMIEKTIPKPSLVLIDKKINKEKIKAYCHEIGIDFMVV